MHNFDTFRHEMYHYGFLLKYFLYLASAITLDSAKNVTVWVTTSFGVNSIKKPSHTADNCWFGKAIHKLVLSLHQKTPLLKNLSLESRQIDTNSSRRRKLYVNRNLHNNFTENENYVKTSYFATLLNIECGLSWQLYIMPNIDFQSDLKCCQSPCQIRY